MDIFVGIIIPTRNRASQVNAILDSLCKSSIKPSQVIIVASGLDIRKSLSKFESKLNITYLHTKLMGQVAQKSLGIKYLDSKIEWCVFSDDDLIFSRTALEEAIKASKSKSEEILGVGFALTNTSRVVTMNKPLRQIAKWVKLDSELKGKVLKSGHATSYLEVSNDQFTEWLNGVSMWRIEMARQYSKYVPEIKPASCEDLVFSYQISKKGKLLFASKAKIEFQDSEKTNPEDFENLSISALWRLYFVISNKELSLKLLLFSQIFRILYSLYSDRRKSFPKLWHSTKWYIRFCKFAFRVSNLKSSDAVLLEITQFIDKNVS